MSKGIQSTCGNCKKDFIAPTERSFCSKRCAAQAQYDPWPQRFWAKVDKTDSCWLWTGGKTRPYGSIRYKGKNLLAHRVSWELEHGTSPPPGLSVMHRCDNPPCVRPDHLFLGTQKDNSQDTTVKGRLRTAKLNQAKANAVRACVAAGMPTPEVGKLFGIGYSHVGAIVRGEFWNSQVAETVDESPKCTCPCTCGLSARQDEARKVLARKSQFRENPEK